MANTSIKMAAPSAVAESHDARRRRHAWPESIRSDLDVQALDEENGEWILCATCLSQFQQTGRGRKPNDPLGFKVKMNGRFQETAWLVHKNRVIAHRSREQSVGMKRRRHPSEDVDLLDTDQDNDGEDSDALVVTTANTLTAPPEAPMSIQIPLSGWRCPGIVPDSFYSSKSGLVHAFAKYYVGSYRINVVRDVRTDRVLLFSHDCTNEIIQRDRHQPMSCSKCYDMWVLQKSFRRILNKMERYVRVESILRRAWSLSEEDVATLTRFVHTSTSNLNIEGRQLKQAVVDVLRHYDDGSLPHN